MENKNSSTKKDDMSSIATFLILECVALLSFCLGGISLIFQYAGFVISIFAFFAAMKNFDKKEIGSLLLIGIPVLLLGIFSAFGKLFGGFSNFGQNFGVLLAIPGFFLLGLSARRIDSFKVDVALICLGVGAALLMLISLVITWVQYGFFYTLLYKGTPNYYYNGALYNVTTEMSWLNGISIIEVSLKYSGLFGLCLCSAIPSLLFISPREETKKFAIVGAIGLVGLLSIITIVNIPALIFLLVAVVIMVIYKCLRNHEGAMKAIKYGLLIIVCIAVALLLFATLNNLIPGLKAFTSGNSVLNRIFNTNRIIKPFNDIMSVLFKPYNLFGFPIYDAGDIQGLNEKIIFTNTGNFVLELTKEGGLFGLLSILMIIVVVVISMTKYLKKSKDSLPIKITFLTLLISFFLYSCFNWEIQPFTHENNYVFVSRSFPFLIILFAAGLCYYPVFVKGEPKFEQIRVVTENKHETNDSEYIDQDYVFTDAKGGNDNEK